jgi:hypothetical protein
MHTTIRRWLGPSAVAVLVVIGYQLLISPVIQDWRADWEFLHAARMQTIQQMQRQQAQPKP